MPTNLAEQLKRLAVPQSSIYTKDKKQPSLLFDPKVAALKDRETFYEIGLSGLRELVALNSSFVSFENTLFCSSSKDFERAVQTKEANKKIDEDIRDFLLQLSPYFLLKSSHKALEWLINRFHIQNYNQDDLMKLILPYHETKIFVRCLQTLKIDSAANKWDWLMPLQKSGISLPKRVLFNRAITDLWLLKFISKMTTKAIRVCGNNAHSLTTLFAFYCTTNIGVLSSLQVINEGHMSALIPTLLKALSSPIVDFKAAGVMILAQLISKAQLKRKTLESITRKLMISESEISYNTVLLLHLIYQNQKSIHVVSEKTLNDFTTEQMIRLSKILSDLLSRGTDVIIFVISLLKGILILISTGVENFKRFKDLPDIIISYTDLNDNQAERVIKCFLNHYSAIEHNKPPDDSDIELIEANESSYSIESWYSLLLKRVNIKYPKVTDAIIKNIFHDSEKQPEISNNLKSILSFHPSVADNMKKTELFKELYHYNTANRIEALNYVVNEFKRLKTEDEEFLYAALLERMRDDDPTVVMTVFKLRTKELLSVLNNDTLAGKDILLNLLKKGYRDAKNWRSVAEMALEILCSLESALDANSISSILPYLFPDDEDSVRMTIRILQSELATKCLLFKTSAKAVMELENKTAKHISQTIFDIFEKYHILNDIEEYFYEFKINQDCTDVMIYIIVKTNLLQENVAATDSFILFNEILSVSNNCKKGKLSNAKKLNAETVNDCFRLCKQNMLPVQVITYMLNAVIDKTVFTYSSKSWLNVDDITDESKLITKLFDIIISGCSHDKYSSMYVSLMKNLMEKICPKLKSKFQFISNFALGHLVQDTSTYSISPELQLRALKFYHSLINLLDDAAFADDEIIYEFDIILAPLLSLSCVYAPIRLECINIIESLVAKEKLNKISYYYLLHELADRSEELSLDNDQLPLILYTLLSQDTLVKSSLTKHLQIQMKKCLNDIIEKMSHFPTHLIAALLSALVHIHSTEILKAASNISTAIVMDIVDNSKIPSIYQYNIVRLVINRITANSVQEIDENHHLWKLICLLLNQREQIFSSETGNQYSACYMILQQLDDDCFNKIPPHLCKIMVQKVCEVGTFGNNTLTISSASRLIKRITLSSSHFSDILKAMISAKDPSLPNFKRSQKSPAAPTISITDSKEWKCGVTLLEYVQNKKKLKVKFDDIPLLFKVLKKCLDFEEQSALEYIKQLLLSCIMHWCQMCDNIDLTKKIEVSESAFDVELIVKCIRGTQNPQTHHHALVLLAYLANILPNQVLHHTMAIFTFIGSSILRHDDAYSFQIISKIIETVIPVLIKFNRNTATCADETMEDIQDVAVPVLRIFVDAVLDVPEHRRLPLYTKLIDTLDPSHFLWVFGALLFEAHVVHTHEDRRPLEASRTLADAEVPIDRVNFGILLFCEFPAVIILKNIVTLMNYLQTLPIEKEEDVNVEIDASKIFSVSGHSAKRLRHFKYTIITFLNKLLTSPSFQHQLNSVSDLSELENYYKQIIVSVLTFIKSVSKTADQNALKPQGKYWKVMLHHSYEILENSNNLLSPHMFVVVIRGLMTHNLPAVCRKSMEILNMKLQHNLDFFTDCERNVLHLLLEPLTKIIQGIKNKKSDEARNQEVQLNQQTALLSLKLLTRAICHSDPEPFKTILVTITDIIKYEDIDRNLMASVVLCLAELCYNLKGHAISGLPKYMPPMIKILKQQRKKQAPELVLLSIITAIYKIVESLPLFLSPYLEKILYELSILSAKWKKSTYDSVKVSPVISKLQLVHSKIATTISPRLLVPLVNQCYSQLVEKRFYNAIGPLMALLAESFSCTSGSELTSLIQEITSFFLVALQLRSDTANDEASIYKQVDIAEGEVVKALVALILKLSETSFRPFYFKIYDWALRSNVGSQKDRAITFYRLSVAIAESLKGLFVLFASHFIKNAADMLDSCNSAKNEVLYFESETKCSILVEYIMKTLNTVFLYDSQNFIDRDKFETLMQPIVDQLENMLEGMESLELRAKNVVIPCIAQFAVATADDSLWKPLNYQILLKTRHSESTIRLLAVDCLVTTAKRLGQGWLPLLAESVPFLSELMEDGDTKVDEAAKDAVRELEQVLGEPLQKYF